jgi:hypothetical protein
MDGTNQIAREHATMMTIALVMNTFMATKRISTTVVELFNLEGE